MDVPVSAGVLLSFGLSVYDAVTGADHAYFEASTSLLFVLLGGRVLDQMMRRKAKSAVSALARMMPRGANMLDDSGRIEYVPMEMIRPSVRLLVAVGDRIPTDGIVSVGKSEIDGSLVSGESSWRYVSTGSEVRAGEINQGQPFTMTASVAPEDSVLSEMTRMLAAAEDGRASYRRLADRAASLYAPIVHSFALLAFAGWFHFSGDLHMAITIAVAVLVVTCPCALGIAVPMVQVVLARRLFEQGVIGTDGSAYERIAEIDTVVLDKTGTLTTGEPSLLEVDPLSAPWLGLAASIAGWSSHPYSKAICTADSRTEQVGDAFVLEDVREVAGYGVEARSGQHVYRLGRPGWAMHQTGGDGETSSVTLSRDGSALAHFRFGETLRPGAAEMVRELSQRGLAIRILSGDNPAAVSRISELLGVKVFSAGLLPGDKVNAISELQSSGHKVLMIGDGINDAPALRASYASMAPSSASDIGRSAADFVFVGGDLAVVAETLDAVHKASRLVKQNFMLAAVYNAVSLPLALAGFVTPLIATIAMSTSSIMVIANALRLGAANSPRQRRKPSAAAAERAA